MTDPTAEFFQKLDQRGHEPLLTKASGTVRFDLAAGSRTECWLLAFNDGDVSVSRENRPADCVVRTDKAVLDGLATGKLNGLTAYLRGQIGLEGNPELLVLVQRVFPGPTAAGGRRQS
jgi:putative sterol carrier protein